MFRVQDTPGYGDDQDISKHIHLIIGHINAQNVKWLEMESARDRCGPTDCEAALGMPGCGS